VAALSTWQIPAVIDQQVLGCGRDDSPLIVMGTKEAYDATHGSELVWACTSEAIWMCGSSPEVLNRLDPVHFALSATVGLRPFHLQPNDLWQIHKRGRSTWRLIAQLLRPDDPASLLRRPVDGASIGLGDLCYQIEVSAFPSRQARRGQTAAPERVAFLRELVKAFREARVLLFHGGKWEEARQDIAAQFLDQKPDLQQRHVERRRWYASATNGKRSVLHTYALNGRVPDAYLNLVREKLRELAPELIPG
jgi:hypothetical protein